MGFSKKHGMNIPQLDSHKTYPLGDNLCPAIGYDIVHEGIELYGSEGSYSMELGNILSSYAAYAINSDVIKGASSGGVMSQLLLFVLEKGIADKVACTKFIYTENGPRTNTILTSKLSDILDCQGSKYCPVDISSFLVDLREFNGKVAFIGTPCQVAGLRKLQKVVPELKEKVVLTIANFCGGFKSYKSIQKLSKRHGVRFDQIEYLRFRGGGQPGSLLVYDSFGKRYEAPYPNYTGYTGYSKILRCHLCVDATGELADIACGDAWIDRYIEHKKQWSIVVGRSKFAREVIEQMCKERVIYCEALDQSEIIKSQWTNIKSKKIRQAARFALYEKLGYEIPKFDGGYSKYVTSMLFELRVFCSHKFKELLEELGLYKTLRIILKKRY
ncbi:MAG: hypothetical protein GX219_10460 [Tissierellia bacterium]|jgi:coenzyme F420 hydrogenase subunit beta|nr:hypothetical protein [Tissierellia bacterium]